MSSNYLFSLLLLFPPPWKVYSHRGLTPHRESGRKKVSGRARRKRRRGGNTAVYLPGVFIAAVTRRGPEFMSIRFTLLLRERDLPRWRWLILGRVKGLISRTGTIACTAGRAASVFCWLTRGRLSFCVPICLSFTSLLLSLCDFLMTSVFSSFCGSLIVSFLGSFHVSSVPFSCFMFFCHLCFSSTGLVMFSI